MFHDTSTVFFAFVVTGISYTISKQWQNRGWGGGTCPNSSTPPLPPQHWLLLAPSHPIGKVHVDNLELPLLTVLSQITFLVSHLNIIFT